MGYDQVAPVTDGAQEKNTVAANEVDWLGDTDYVRTAQATIPESDRIANTAITSLENGSFGEFFTAVSNADETSMGKINQALSAANMKIERSTDGNLRLSMTDPKYSTIDRILVIKPNGETSPEIKSPRDINYEMFRKERLDANGKANFSDWNQSFINAFKNRKVAQA